MKNSKSIVNPFKNIKVGETHNLIYYVNEFLEYFNFQTQACFLVELKDTKERKYLIVDKKDNSIIKETSSICEVHDYFKGVNLIQN